MLLESLTAAIRGKAAGSPPLGYRVKLDLGADGVIFWDGAANPPSVDNMPRPADATIGISLADLEALLAGTLSPTVAYMTGRLKVEGSLGVALKINQILED